MNAYIQQFKKSKYNLKYMHQRRCIFEDCYNRAIFAFNINQAPIYCIDHRESDTVPVCFMYCNYLNCKKRMHYEENMKNKSNILYIGDLDNGIDRHKSLLFKYLCDQLNLQCCIFRYVNISDNKIYDKHVWNLIKINECIYVIDFRLFPNKIVKPTDKNTENYYKINEFIL